MPVRTSEQAAGKIIRRLREHGHTALLAGGCVRDRLLGRAPADHDVATNAPPVRVQELFRHTRLVGEQFGVVLVKHGRWWVEVATFRTDLAYKDGRHPEGVVFSTPQEDAKRRDFTINGMFFDPTAGEVIDYVGGRADLEAGVVRAIGDAHQRFAEDRLRMLRAVRFAARLAFALDPATRAAITEHAAAITCVSAERICEELDKMLTDPHRAAAIAMADDCGLMDHLWPNADWFPARAQRAVDTLSHLPERADFATGLAALLGTYARAEVDRICRHLTCSNPQRKTAVWLVENQDYFANPDAVELADLKLRMAHPAWPMLLALFRARLLALALPTQPYESLCARAAAVPPDRIAPSPLLTGDDLIARGFTPGPDFGRTLDATYRAQLNEEVATLDQALAIARTLLPPSG